MRLKSLVRDSILYGGAAVASKGMALATFPLILAELELPEYGTLDLFGHCLSLASVVVVFGLDSALGRLLHDHEPAERARFVSTVLLLQASILCCVLPLLAFGSWLWMPTDFSSFSYVHLAVLLIVQLPFSVAYSLAAGLSQWTFSRSAYLFLTLGFTVLQAALTVAGTLLFDLSVVQIAMIMAGSAIFFGCVGLFYLSSFIVFQFDRAAVHSVLRFAWPFGVIGLLGAIGPVVERSIVLNQLGTEDLGLYSVAGKLAGLMAIVSIAFQTAWGPFAVVAHREDDGTGCLFSSVLWLVTIGMTVGAFCLAALSGPLLDVFSVGQYASSVPLVLPLALSAGVSAIAAVMQVDLLISKKSHFNLIAEVAFFVSLVTLAWLGASRFGSTAVAYATLAASIVRCYLLFAFSEGVFSSGTSHVGVWCYILGSSGAAIAVSGLIFSPSPFEFVCVCAGFAVVSLFTGLVVLRFMRNRPEC